ncbi:hypothetical protein [Gimesia maris]|uniref:hypothetical protein n=1 Tax=Gimesia maris TaxID=122 RepID=UPI003A9260F7
MNELLIKSLVEEIKSNPITEDQLDTLPADFLDGDDWSVAAEIIDHKILRYEIFPEYLGDVARIIHNLNTDEWSNWWHMHP